MKILLRTSPSRGNQVDGLPRALNNTEAVCFENKMVQRTVIKNDNTFQVFLIISIIYSPVRAEITLSYVLKLLLERLRP